MKELYFMQEEPFPCTHLSASEDSLELRRAMRLQFTLVKGSDMESYVCLKMNLYEDTQGMRVL